MAFIKISSSPLLLIIVFFALLLLPYVAAAASNQHCPREIWDVLWGGLAALVALLIQGLDRKNMFTRSRLELCHGWITLDLGKILMGVGRILLPDYFLLESVLLVRKARWMSARAPSNQKDLCKILAAVEIWIGFPDACRADLPRNMHVVRRHEMQPPEDALIIGTTPEDHVDNELFCRTIGRVDDEGDCGVQEKEALMRAELLPNLKQLEIVQAKTILASIIVAMQALGYLFQVLFRVLNGLGVSPVEALSVVIYVTTLLQVLFHPLMVSCNRAIVLHLNQHQVLKFLTKYDEIASLPEYRLDSEDYDPVEFFMACMMVIYLVVTLVIPLTFAILYFKSSNVIAGISLLLYLATFISMPLVLAIIFLFTCKSQMFEGIGFNIMVGMFIFVVGIPKYIVAIVATMKFWDLYEAPDPRFSSLLPHIG